MTFTGFGVPVLGTIDDVARVARRRQVQEVIIAIPSADRRAMRRIVERGREVPVTMGRSSCWRWGKPVRITEMARDLVRLSGLEPGRDIEIVCTGLRPGEKLAEELWTGTADIEPTAQDTLLVVHRPEAEGRNLERLLVQMESLEGLAKAGDVEHLIPALRRVVPEYQPIAVGAGGNGGVVPRAAGGAASVAGAAVTFVRPTGATNGGAGSDHARYGASGANGSAQRWPGRPGNGLPARGSPPAGESRPAAS